MPSEIAAFAQAEFDLVETAEKAAPGSDARAAADAVFHALLEHFTPD